LLGHQKSLAAVMHWLLPKAKGICLSISWELGFVRKDKRPVINWLLWCLHNWQLDYGACYIYSPIAFQIIGITNHLRWEDQYTWRDDYWVVFQKRKDGIVKQLWKWVYSLWSGVL